MYFIKKKFNYYFIYVKTSQKMNCDSTHSPLLESTYRSAMEVFNSATIPLINLNTEEPQDKNAWRQYVIEINLKNYIKIYETVTWVKLELLFQFISVFLHLPCILSVFTILSFYSLDLRDKNTSM